ncbi:ThiS family protein [Leptospira broomii serovar Hurstbridge str. 5399]|uniref:ThiS family protein n=2 Tax=Leptospira broomii TaxID=301541 RepID=T0F6Y4_9LEPT|nr:ThiS family protein [Leptospira broomii serovar Hurstbridge str. 5399]
MKDFFPAKENIDLESIRTISDLRSALESKNPLSAPLLRISRFAVDQVIVAEDHSLVDGQTVAVLPPSSGG